MSIARFSIQQPVLVNLFMIFIIIAGLFAFNSISKEEFPEISLNAVTIITTYPGVSPEEIEELITKPIEEEVADVDDIDNVDDLEYKENVEKLEEVVMFLILRMPIMLMLLMMSMM